MIEMTDDLMVAMRRFKDVFGDIVPLQEIPQETSTRDVIDAIDESIKQNANILPMRFGYKQLEEQKGILM